MDNKELAQKILDIAQEALRESGRQWTAGGSGGAIRQGLNNVINVCLAELGITEEQIPDLPGNDISISKQRLQSELQKLERRYYNYAKEGHDLSRLLPGDASPIIAMQSHLAMRDAVLEIAKVLGVSIEKTVPVLPNPDTTTHYATGSGGANLALIKNREYLRPPGAWNSPRYLSPEERNQIKQELASRASGVERANYIKAVMGWNANVSPTESALVDIDALEAQIAYKINDAKTVDGIREIRDADLFAVNIEQATYDQIANSVDSGQPNATEAILACIAEHGPITAQAIADKTGYVLHVVEVTLEALQRRGLVYATDIAMIGEEAKIVYMTREAYIARVTGHSCLPEDTQLLDKVTEAMCSYVVSLGFGVDIDPESKSKAFRRVRIFKRYKGEEIAMDTQVSIDGIKRMGTNYAPMADYAMQEIDRAIKARQTGIIVDDPSLSSPPARNTELTEEA